MNRAECLEYAKEIVCHDRDEAYGKPENNFGTIAELWSAYLGTEIKPIDVAMMMIMLKMSRVKNGKLKDDNFIDIAGYSACACEMGVDE